MRLAVVCLIFFGFSSGALARDLDRQEKTMISKTVAKDFKDPESAQFRWLPLPDDTKESLIYCGMVNGKNSFGAYVGYSPFAVFVAFRNRKVIAAGPLGAGAPLQQVLLKLCADNGFNLDRAR